jgi:RNA polymerase sigma-70 factor (ECF subfamily)
VTDLQLVEQTLAGSEEGFRTLVARHERSVYNLLVRILRNPALAEELAQDTFLKAFMHLRSFDPRYKFSNWILRIAHNAAIDAVRRRGPQELSLDEPVPHEQARFDTMLVDPKSGAAAASVEQQDVGRLLQAAMDRLRPEYCQAVVLRYQEDLSYDEISEITGWPLGTIKSHLHRARAEMADYLRRKGLGPGGAQLGTQPTATRGSRRA